MEWYNKLSTRRKNPVSFYQRSSARSEFQRDVDEIIFSKAFKRLADKTSVHSLKNKNDHSRTRLTHSLEVASVGRSMGTLLGETLYEYKWSDCWDKSQFEDKGFTISNFGTVLYAAGLAHDIGNTPFGHSCEEAIRKWFKHNENSIKGLCDKEFKDFLYFDGNAQGFRVLTKLGDKSRGSEGLNLTYATLGTFVKYPFNSSSILAKEKSKYGLMCGDEIQQFRLMAAELALNEKNES